MEILTGFGLPCRGSSDWVAQIFVSVVAHFFMSVCGSNIHERLAHFFIDIYMIIGFQNRMVFRMFQDTDYCIKNGAVGFQIYAMLDCAAVQPKHIAKITGIKETGKPASENDGE